ncbi:hypothetical protein [Aeromonas jandaei]
MTNVTSSLLAFHILGERESAAQLKASLTDLLRLLEAEDLSPEARQDATDRIMRMMPDLAA